MRRRARRSTSQSLPVAVRAYVPLRKKPRPRRRRPNPELVLVFDTETTTDPTQRLLFASYRVYRNRRLVQEGLVAGDGLTEGQVVILEAYVADHAADHGGELKLLTRREFLNEVLWRIGYQARARIVGFNLPFDLSRLAVGVRPARRGGFSLRLWDSADDDGRLRPHLWRAELRIKADGSKRQFIQFAPPRRIDDANIDAGHAYRGRFVDLHTLAYALTDRSLTLDAAAIAFGAAERKEQVERHGVLSASYIDYNRQDVRTTWALYEALMDEWDRHPVVLEPEQGFSPAAVSKAYLRAMGITPPLSRRGSVTDTDLGHVMVAYYGGRAEVRIRRSPVPVRYVDYTSMYPTVVALLGLWAHLIADHFETRDVTAEVQAYLDQITREELHSRERWPFLAGVFCRVRLEKDLLPARAPYGHRPPAPAPSLTIGLNYITSSVDLWYSLADLVAAKVLTGRTPEILEAIRIAPVGELADLEAVALRGELDVDPRADDLFRLAIETRQRDRHDPARTQAERERLAQFLKTFANGGAYGVFIEYHQLEPKAAGVEVGASGLFEISARVRTPEEPGEFCWPPIAVSVTAAARLLLALLEADVETAGGTYVACDTDSLLIVASADGGLVPCPRGSDRLPDDRPAVRALSYAEVDAVLAEINRLNPYDPDAVPSLIKLEPENFDPKTRALIPLFAIGISAKRYVLYNRGPNGPVIRKASTHGLGPYRKPIPDPPGWDKAWPYWVEVVWDRIIRELEGLPLPPEPAWFAHPAVSQLPISSPHVLTPFRTLNADKAYAEQIKPFNFLLVGHTDPLVPLPEGVEPGVVPITQFSTDPAGLLDQPWWSRSTGERLRVTTDKGGEPGAVRLKTYGDVYRDYRLHPETKSGDPAGGPGHRGSRGFLPRLELTVAGVPVHIGKESNHLEEVEAGEIVEFDEAYVEYRHPRAEWEAALPILRQVRAERGSRYLAEASGLSERAVRYALNGGKVPHSKARVALLALLVDRS